MIHEIQIRRVKALQEINGMLKVKPLNEKKTKFEITGKNVKLIERKERYWSMGKDGIRRLRTRKVFYAAPAREIKWIDGRRKKK